MANRIQLRRDTQANWERVNPILEDGEPGLDITQNKIKYGDGSSTWTELAYASGGSSGSISFDYSTVQEGESGPIDVTSITGNPGVGVSLTSDEWAQLMWTPNTANVTIDNIGDGGNVYNWAYVDDSGFNVENDTGTDNYKWKFDTNGVLTFPNNTLTISHGMGDGIISTDSMTIGASGGLTLSSLPDSGNLSQINLDGYGNIQLRSIASSGADLRWDFNSDGTMTFPNGNNNINKQRYGMGNLVAYLDGEWTLGEYNGTVYGNTGIRISPGIEGAVELTLPSNQTANVNPASFANYEGNVEIRSSNLTWKYDTAGNLSLPSDAKLIAGYPGYGYIANTAALAGDNVYLTSTDGNAWIGVETGVARIGYESTQKYWNFGTNGTLTTPGNVTIGSGYGNISQIDTIFANNYAYANGVSILDGLSGGASTGNIRFNSAILYSSYEPDNIYISTLGGDYDWTFGTDGNLTLPGGGAINYANGVSILSNIGGVSTGNIVFNGTDIGLDAGTIAVGGVLTIAPNLEGQAYLQLPNDISANVTNTRLWNRIGNVEIGAGKSGAGGGVQAWYFNQDGKLILPNGNFFQSQNGQGETNIQIVDNESPFKIYTHASTGAQAWVFGADGSTTFPDHGNVSMTGTLTVGNLTVNGSTTTISTNSYVVTDNIVQFAADNPADTLDIGFVGHRTVNGTLQHTGLVRDASTGIWELFSNVTAQPGTTVDFTQALLDDLQLDKLYADTIHLTGTAPSTNAGSAGDLEGDIHVDDNYLYYCTQDWTASSWTVGWEGSVGDTLFITKGDYPTPQVGWTVSFGAYGPWTIDTIVDNGTSWQITWVGANFGSPAGGTATLTNTDTPAVIWKTVPLTAFQTGAYGNTQVANYLTTNPQAGTYSNTNVASYLSTYIGNITANFANVSSLTVNGTTTVAAISEKFVSNASPGSLANVAIDFSQTAIVYVTTPSGNITANIQNFSIPSGTISSVTVWISQGVTPYVANSVQINNAMQTIKWQASAAPGGNASKQDVISFTILNSSGTYTVLGQLATFG